MIKCLATLPDTPPRLTIGWDVIRWCEAHMRSPMGDGSRLRLTAEQARFVAWWFSVGEDGRWLYRRGVLRRAKGWGKDPLAAVLALAEMLGPCRFDGWDSAGRPVGGPVAQANVAVAAVSETATQNTTDLLEVVAGDLVARYRFRYGARISRGVSMSGRRAVLRPVTSAWRSSEGKRFTAVIAGETQHWRAADGGHEMGKVIARNLAKSPDGSARVLAITNAHSPGEDSVAERDHDAWLAQCRAATSAAGGVVDILMDSREAVVGDDFDVLDTAANDRGDAGRVRRLGVGGHDQAGCRCRRPRDVAGGRHRRFFL